MTFGKAIKKVIKSPKKILRMYEMSPNRQAIETVAINAMLRKYYTPVEKALEKAIAKQELSRGDKKALKTMLKKLQKGKGYTARTRKAFDKQLPPIIEKACNNTCTEKDLKDLEDVQEFVAWAKNEETMKVYEERKLL